MKEKLKNHPWVRAWFYTQSPLIITRPALRETAACMLLALGGFVLSCGGLHGNPLPCALSLLAAAGGGLRGLACLVGAAAGYLTMQPFSRGLERTSSAILIYVCSYIFGSLWITRRTWFRCLVSGGMTAAVGLIFLMSQKMTAALGIEYLGTVLLAGLLPLSYSAMLDGKRNPAALAAAGSFLLGLSAIPMPLGMTLGGLLAVAASAVGVRRGSVSTAAILGLACGLAVDLSGGTGQWTLILGASSLVGAGSTRRSGLMRLAAFGVTAAAAAGILGLSTPGTWLTISLGLPVSFLLPGAVLVGREKEAEARAAELVEMQLREGQQALEQIYEAAAVDPESRIRQDCGKVFDRAAARVCRRCSRYAVCWEKDAGRTYGLLAPMLGDLTDRRSLERDDFPVEFADSCRQMDGFVLAVNQELERLQGTSQIRYRRQEDRIIVSRYALHLSRMLARNARALRQDRPSPREAYRARLGVAARGRGGSRLSGDRGVSFQTEDGRFILCLCDGAGTGASAAEESMMAVDTLTRLIQAGMPPADAMELLNGMYVLRDSGGFSTMDVLELSLLSGRGTLYKWGAAPSYLRTENGVRRLGTPAPPPGLEAKSGCGAETVPLELWGGDLLVMVSDGAAGEETENLLETWSGDNVKALAGAVIDCASAAGGRDDMTAAVLRVTAIER